MDCKKIGENISTYRKAKKLTQKQLADLIDKAESSVQKYEKGETEAPISVLEKISTALDVPLQYLLDWTNQESLNNIIAGIKPEFERFISSLGYKLVYRPGNSIDGSPLISVIDHNEKTIEITLEEINSLMRSTESYVEFKMHELFSSSQK